MSSLVRIKVHFSTPVRFNFGSWVVRSSPFGIKLPYSHVSIEFSPQKNNNKLVFECKDYGVRLLGLGQFYRKNKVLRSFDVYLSQERMVEVENFIYASLGEEYSIRGILNHITTNLTKKPILTKKNTKGYNCSEIIYLCLHKELFSFVGELYCDWPHLIPPDAIYKALMKRDISLKNIKEDLHFQKNNNRPEREDGSLLSGSNLMLH